MMRENFVSSNPPEGNMMPNTPPVLEQFRLEFQPNGLVHLVFDCPGRTMNVFSNAAIHELGAFASWLVDADVKGVLIRSGKENAFCAGADLTELGVAYDMIMQAPPRDRFNVAFDHFFPLSKALRALETAGKPVAAAIAGLALGGGCELALGAHYRVLVDDPKIGMGLPESLVGLLPGAGGTQRLPRLVGLEACLPILLEGARLGGQDAMNAGLVHELVQPGEEVARAEAWLLSGVKASQPWDRADWKSPSTAGIEAVVAPLRAKADPAYPAPIAILDCVQYGLPQTFEGAIRSEMAIFAYLIQRPEARNMIQTLFLGKTDYDRLKRKDALPSFVADAVAAVKAVPGDRNDGKVLAEISKAISPWLELHSSEELRLADYAVVKEIGYPSYLGGPFSFAVRGFD
jgi:3-hydroxyacyl-CoA dehydrogenase / enoyl-CoA hydratase / 3-hydroxybutyryl-CoA epimerase